MSHQQRIAQSFTASGISRVLVIDDAFDAPPVDGDLAAKLLTFLEDDGSGKILRRLSIDSASLDATKDAIYRSEYDNPNLNLVINKIYNEFTKNLDPKYDFEGSFKQDKEAALSPLIPLLKLLSQCGRGVEIRTAGLNDAFEKLHEYNPQVVFLDYFLSPAPMSGGEYGDALHTQAYQASLELARKLADMSGENMPAIVLMSSESVGSRAGEFRNQVNNNTKNDRRILSWRFNFLGKGGIKLEEGRIVISPDAADTLLDVSQSYIFGNHLHRGIEKWRDGVQKAVDQLMIEISNLDLKDFSYLMRFRLKEEGQPFSQYMQWLFGECLIETVNQNVEWSDQAFKSLDSDDKTLNRIEGAYDGATTNIARIFDRARIERQDRSEETVVSKRLGDIYISETTKEVRAIITPDCDLVIRDKGPKVKKPLTISGQLKLYNSPTTTLADFIIKDNIAHSIQWERKNIEGVNFEEESNSHFKYIGTLRPLYAQELQRSVLNDLSRIGLSVAPVIGMTAHAFTSVRRSDGTWLNLNDDAPEQANCTIMPPRGGKDIASRIIFHRAFVHKLIAQLKEIDLDQISENHRPFLANAIRGNSEDGIYKSLCRDGIIINKSYLGIGVVMLDSDDVTNWCRIVVNYVSGEDESNMQSGPDQSEQVDSSIAESSRETESRDDV